jgi:hypothetical protein
MGADVPSMNALRKFADSVTVLVSSCDAFFDAWRPFAFFFRKFWPECPFRIRLITNRLEVRSSLIRALPVGKDLGWASNTQLALERIATPYVLYLQEDYFLTAPVDSAQLARDFSYALERGAAACTGEAPDWHRLDRVHCFHAINAARSLSRRAARAHRDRRYRR